MSKKITKNIINLKNLFKKRGKVADNFAKTSFFIVNQEYLFGDFKITTTKYGDAIVSSLQYFFCSQNFESHVFFFVFFSYLPDLFDFV